MIYELAFHPESMKEWVKLNRAQRGMRCFFEWDRPRQT
jgi:hypothetical protein